MNQRTAYELPEETIARLKRELAAANAEIARLRGELAKIATYYDDDSIGNGLDNPADYLIRLAIEALKSPTES